MPLSDFTCTISFNRDRTNVVINYAPGDPNDKKFQFVVGDTITFMSNDAPWKVGYPSSPLHSNGGTSVLEGGVGPEGAEKVTILRPGRFSWDCGLFNGRKYVGYGEGGGDPVGPTGG